MIPKKLFDLSESEEKTSQAIYSGKIIKCLVTPFHTYEQLDKMIEYSQTTFLFPEREFSLNMLSNFINIIVNNPKIQEAKIITANQNILLDMVDSSVRILTENEEIVPCPIKTFMANIHDIRYSIFENKSFKKSEVEMNKGVVVINNLITDVNNGIKTGLTSEKINELKTRTKLIGEQIVRTKLMSMIDDIKIIQ